MKNRLPSITPDDSSDGVYAGGQGDYRHCSTGADYEPMVLT
jgi:hypothetical protein